MIVMLALGAGCCAGLVLTSWLAIRIRNRVREEFDRRIADNRALVESAVEAYEQDPNFDEGYE